MSGSEDSASDFSAADSDAPRSEELNDDDWVPFYVNPDDRRREIPTVVYVHGIAGSEHQTWQIGEHAPLPSLIKAHLEAITDPSEYGYSKSFTFQYNPALLFEGLGRCNINLELIALRLLETLYDDNIYFYDPVVIVAHDIGGIIAKKALMLAKEYTRFRSIAVDVKRLVLLGTPQTVDVGDWEELLVDFSVALRGLELRHLVTTMSFQDAAAQFAAVTKQFLTSARDYRLLSIYQGDAQLDGNVSRIIVPKGLAVAGAVEERTLPRCRNHFQLGQFTSEDDQVKILGDFIMAATLEFDAFDYYRIDYLDLLKTITPSQGSAALFSGNKISRNSFDWIMEDETFRTWRESPSASILHLHGVSGSGKTTMSQYLTDYFAEQEAIKGVIVVAYFCNSDEHANGDVDDLCSSLTAQILLAKRILYRRIYEAYHLLLNWSRPVWAAYEASFLNEPNRWHLLRALFSCAHQEQIICIIDAVDECQGKVSDFLHEIVDLVSKLKTPLKIIITSANDSPKFTDPLKGCLDLSLDERESMQIEAEKGIDESIDDLIRHRPALKSFKQEILECICRSRPLNLLDANLKVKYLRSAVIQSTPNSVRLALEKASHSSPKAALESAMDIADQSIKRWALRALSWMTYASRPLRLGELATCLAMLDWFEFDDPADEHLSRDLKADLEYVLGAVVSIDDNVVRFAHPAIRDLVKTHVETHQLTTDLSAISHRTIFRTCLAYLSKNRLENAWSELDSSMLYQPGTDLADLPQYSHSFGLVLYAVQYWFVHFQKREDFLEEDIHDVHAFLRDRWEQYENFALAILDLPRAFDLGSRAVVLGLPSVYQFQLDQDKTTEDRDNSEMNYPDHMKLAAAVDCVPILEQIRARFPVRQIDYAKALTVSLYFKSDSAASFAKEHLTLASEWDPSDSRGMTGDSAGQLLKVAASAGLHDLVERAIKSVHNSSTLIPQPLVVAAVRAAASANHCKTLEVVLDSAENIKQDDEDAPNSSIQAFALHEAVLHGHLPVIEFLVKSSMIKLHTDFAGRSTLHLACIIGIQSIVSQIVDKDNANQTDQNSRTPLHYAAVSGSVDVVQTLLDAGAEIECRDVNEETPLFLAVTFEQIEMVRLLLSKGARANVVNKIKEPLLQVAIYSGIMDMVVTLSDSGSDLNQVGASGRTPLLYSLFSRMGHVEVAHYLIDKGVDLEAKDKDGDNPIILAATKRMTDVVQKLLDKGANPMSRDSAGCTALHRAAQQGSVATLVVLLEHGHDVDVRDHSEKTPLHYAAEYGNRDCVDVLLNHGATADVIDTYRQRPVDYSPAGKRFEAGYLIMKRSPQCPIEDATLQRLFHNAAIVGDVEAAKLILSRSTNPHDIVNSKDDHGDSDSAIYNAIHGGSIEILELVFANGADLTKTIGDKRGPLQRAASAKRLNMVQYLIDKGADINHIDKADGTALHIAAASNMELVQYLLEHNASVNILDVDLLTPLQKACWDIEITQALLNAGAQVSMDGGDMNALNYALRNYDTTVTPQITKLLMKHGATVVDADVRGMTAMHYVAQTNLRIHFEEYLNMDDLALTRRDKQGRNALHFAAATNQVDMVSLIMEKLGLDNLEGVDLADDDGWTPLHWAAKSYSEATWAYLLRHRIDVSATARNGWTAQHVATYNGNGPLFRGCLEQFSQLVEWEDISTSDKHTVNKMDEDAHHAPNSSVVTGGGDGTDMSSATLDRHDDSVAQDVGEDSLTKEVHVSHDHDGDNIHLRIKTNSVSHFTENPAESVAASDNEAAVDKGSVENESVNDGSNRRSTSQPPPEVTVIDPVTGFPTGPAKEQRVACVHCMTFIWGPMFECLVCNRYYVCFKCGWRRIDQHPFHRFNLDLVDGEIMPFPISYHRPLTKELIQEFVDRHEAQTTASEDTDAAAEPGKEVDELNPVNESNTVNEPNEGDGHEDDGNDSNAESDADSDAGSDD